MNRFSKLQAASLVCFGIVSVAGAQTSPSSPDSTSNPAKQQRSTEFEHPMLEKRSGHDMRRTPDQGPRIERRGGQEILRDGEIQRNTVPEGSDRAPAQEPVPSVPSEVRQPVEKTQ